MASVVEAAVDQENKMIKVKIEELAAEAAVVVLVSLLVKVVMVELLLVEAVVKMEMTEV